MNESGATFDRPAIAAVADDAVAIAWPSSAAGSGTMVRLYQVLGSEGLAEFL